MFCVLSFLSRYLGHVACRTRQRSGVPELKLYLNCRRLSQIWLAGENCSRLPILFSKSDFRSHLPRKHSCDSVLRSGITSSTAKRISKLCCFDLCVENQSFGTFAAFAIERKSQWRHLRIVSSASERNNPSDRHRETSASEGDMCEQNGAERLSCEVLQLTNQ